MKIFEKEIEPDVDELLAVIRREAIPKRVHFIELFLDDEIKDLVRERLELDYNPNEKNPYHKLSIEIKLHAALGYDVFCIPLAWDAFKIKTISATGTTSIKDQKRSQRQWTEEHSGPIQSFEDFEKYRWPKISDVNFSPLEWLEKHLPSNMGCYDLTASIFEIVTMLLGYETFCLKLYDEPELVNAIFEKVGNFYLDYTNALCDFSCVKLIWGSDDMGFRTSTLVSDQILRQMVLPWHKHCAEIAHKKGRPYLLHSCGELTKIMNDLIYDVNIDAKHSFEDTILPVTEAKSIYGNQVAILGGIDVDFLCREDENEIRNRVKQTLEICMANGGYCLGTGNTVANYIPLDNYLTMLDEGRKFVC
jgi:uroporphyrinogen decarboxylase